MQFIKNNKRKVIFIGLYILFTLMICAFIKKGSTGLNEISISNPSLSSNGFELVTDEYSIPASTIKVDLTYSSNVDCQAVVMMEGAYLAACDVPFTGDGNYNVVSLPCTVPWSTSDFTVRFTGAGEGEVILSNLVITSDRVLYNDITLKSVLTFIVLIFALVIILILQAKKLTPIQGVVIACLSFATFFVSTPLFADVIYEGHDLLGLSGRIEGIKDAWACGQAFPVVMPYANNGYGYLEFMYPESFLLIPAFLRRANVSMVGALHTYIFIINILTTIITYLSVKSVLSSISDNDSPNNKCELISLVSTLFYLFAQYRLADLYIRAAIGEAVSMTFLPLLIAGLYHLLKGSKRNWWMAAIGMTGVLQSHILSTAMFIPIIVIFVAFYAVDIFKEKRFIEIVKALILFLVLNTWFIIPFVKYYFFGLNTDALVINDPWNHTVLLSQLFSTSKGMAGQDYFLRTLGISSIVALTIVIISVFEYFYTSTQSQTRNFAVSNKLLGCISIIFACNLLLSLDITPYKWLFNLNNLTNTVLSMLQFPFRLLTISTACLVFMLAIALYNSVLYSKHLVPITLAMAIVGLIGSGELIDDYQSFTIGLSPISGGFCTHVPDDYLPAGIDKAIFSDTNAYIDNGEIECVKRGTNVTLNYISSEDTTASIPLLYYPCYEAKLEDGSKITLFNRDDKRIGLNLPAGEHTVSLDIDLY